MTEGGITHTGFSDESNWNKGRFRSLGLVTVPLSVLPRLDLELRQLLNESNVSEFKWNELKGAKQRFAAQKMCALAVSAACDSKLRADVLVWDTRDSRHDVLFRDDVANLERMYYHLFRNVLRARWPDNAVWRLHPDEHSEIDWNTIFDCLENASTNLHVEHSTSSGGEMRVRLRHDFGIEEISSVSSEEHSLLQMSDLFAGMAVFSRDKYKDYETWLADRCGQVGLFDEQADSLSYSRSSKERFEVLRDFDDLCKQRKLGVSLKTNRGLWTPRPTNPINFWMYEPQHPGEIAPVRDKG